MMTIQRVRECFAGVLVAERLKLCSPEWDGIMRKTRLYLEASPIIMMCPGQDPIRQAITKEFYRIVAEQSDEYELFLSRVTLRRIGRCKDGRKTESLC